MSQLCATGTVLVAPLGLTFARPQNDLRPSSSPFFSVETPPPRRTHLLPQTSRLGREQTSTPSPQSMTALTPPTATTFPSRPFTSAAGPPSTWDSHRSSMIREDWDTGHNTLGASLAYTNSQSPSQRPSSSVDGHPVRRSAAYSSTSTTPFITPAKQPIHKPNKLVKRSLSQTVGGTSRNRDNVAQKPLFKRPNSSYHKPEAWDPGTGTPSDNSSPLSHTLPAANGSRAGFDEATYIHFPRIVKARKTAKGLSRQIVEKDPDSIRRIRPDGSRLTLLFARSVIPARIEPEEASHFESDIETPSKRLQSSPVYPSSPLNPSSSAQSSLRSERHRRQSFGYFRSSPNRGLSSSHGPASTLKRKLSQRISSAPTAPISHMSSSPAPQGRERTSDTERSTILPNSSQLESGPTPSTRSSSNHRQATPTSMLQQPRHISLSSVPSSSPDGSYRGGRVFSWGEGEESGSTSETVYDSFRTGTTRSSYGTARQPLETLFDKSTTTVDDTRQSSHQPRNSQRPESVKTFSTDDRISFVSAQATPQATSPRRSPPLHDRKWSTATDINEDFADDEAEWETFSNDLKGHNHSPFLLVRSDTPRLSQSPHDRSATPRADPGLRNSVFDWSEPQPLDKGSDHETPPRPKTVHGKKRHGALGNQSTGRRAQGGLHARSQSVPAFKDVTGRRPDVTHKFGTWGVGAKGATEDWDDDFDFGQPSQSSPVPPAMQASPIPSNFTPMRIPDNIQKQQNNVLANIGLLKEWGLLIEELKDLRVRAASLGIRNGEHSAVFDEVDAMVDLADQEHEDDALSTLRSPASSHFSEDDNEGSTPPRAIPAGTARKSPSEMLRAVQQSNSVHSSPNVHLPESPEPSTNRPRKDSEAIAQSVIQALQRGKQHEPESSTAVPSARQKKMPFDTNTLKHIVPHVHSLMRQVKQLIKEVEGLHTSPTTDRQATYLRKASPILTRSESPSALRELRLRFQRTPRDSAPAPEALNEEDDELEEQLQKLDMS